VRERETGKRRMEEGKKGMIKDDDDDDGQE